MDIILITGADGFIGSHLVDYFCRNDYFVVALIKPNKRVKNLNHYIRIEGKSDQKKDDFEDFAKIPTNNEKITLVRCDLKNTNLMEKIVNEFKPNIILHFGAQSLVQKSWQDPINTIEVNVIGTINIFEAIKKFELKPRVIVACSSAEYGTTTKLNRPLKENDPLMAIHPYGISKIATELLSRQYFLNFGIDSVNLRFFNQTGRRKTNDACSDFAREIAKIDLGLKKPKIKVGNLNTYRDITDIDDTIQAIYLAVKKGKSGETYNVCSGRKVQIREVLNILLSLSKKKVKVVEDFPEKMRNIDEDVILGDNSKIIEQLGWKISENLESTLKKMFYFWRDYYQNKFHIIS